MRGHIISIKTAKKRTNNNRLLEIENVLPILEETYKCSGSQEDYNKILKLKYEYNSILGKRIEDLLLKLKQKQFELGDKPETLLARQLRESAKQTIHKTKKAKTNQITTDPNKINECFRDFYSDLYTSKCNASQSDFDHFFDSLIAQLSEASKIELEELFTEADVLEAIKSFQPGKTPGPDGFGCESFGSKLAPYILRMINDSYKNKRLPSS